MKFIPEIKPSACIHELTLNDDSAIDDAQVLFFAFNRVQIDFGNLREIAHQSTDLRQIFRQFANTHPLLVSY